MSPPLRLELGSSSAAVRLTARTASRATRIAPLAVAPADSAGAGVEASFATVGAWISWLAAPPGTLAFAACSISASTAGSKTTFACCGECSAPSSAKKRLQPLPAQPASHSQIPLLHVPWAPQAGSQPVEDTTSPASHLSASTTRSATDWQTCKIGRAHV